MKTILIGLGKRGLEYADAIKLNENIELVAVCDPNTRISEEVSERFNTPRFNTIDECLSTGITAECAIVVVPHHLYLPIIKTLARNNIAIFKEKPFATSPQEAREISGILNRNNTPMMVMAQRRFETAYQRTQQQLQHIGTPIKIEAKYRFNIERVDEGWRSSSKQAGGGVMIDMGYHMIDLLSWYFGTPLNIRCSTTQGNREGQHYDVEDTAMMTFEYPISGEDQSHKILGVMDLSRVSNKKEESLKVIGRYGSFKIKSSNGHYELVLKDKYNNIIEQTKILRLSKIQLINNALDHFNRYLIDPTCELICDYQDHIEHVNIIAAAYDQPTNNNDYVWPTLSQESYNAVKQQLDKGEISIYNRDGIIKSFEQRFEKYHDIKHALLCNSGTMALYSIFRGLGLSPGDEVISADYTFHATASPLIELGVTVKLADCLPDNGNIDPDKILELLCEKTKAVVITHMWGIPCDLDRIVEICQSRNIHLIEDCSHAHGAKYKGQLVGTFGTAAAWSLQGQKIITGGEGGIAVTNDSDLYYEMLLVGHYNKRCKQEIPQDHPAYQFAETGYGLKLRSHPLAVALANQQFDHLEKWHQQKHQFACYMNESLEEFEFLTLPDFSHTEPAWYAYTFLFDEQQTNITAADFVQLCKRAGLDSVDHPKSTRPLHMENLFKKPNQARPGFFSEYKPEFNCPNAEKFYKQAVKIPVWAFEEDWPTVKRYVETIKQLCCTVEAKRDLARSITPELESPQYS